MSRTHRFRVQHVNACTADGATVQGIRQRFFLHDHLNRLSKGVHSTTPNTTFTYFVEQLGFAVFPWVALLPGALTLVGRLSPRERSPRVQAAIFTALWALIAFVVFTLSATKFHHYCFPLVPPLACRVTPARARS